MINKNLFTHEEFFVHAIIFLLGIYTHHAKGNLKAITYAQINVNFKRNILLGHIINSNP